MLMDERCLMQLSGTTAQQQAACAMERNENTEALCFMS